MSADAFATNGLVELIALDNGGTLLALERSFSTGVGNTIKLYEARIGDATASGRRGGCRSDAERGRGVRPPGGATPWP